MKISTATNSSIFIPQEFQQSVSLELKAYNLTLDNGIFNIPNGLIGYLSVSGFYLEINPSIPYMTFLDYFNMLVANIEDISEKGIDWSTGVQEISQAILDAFHNELVSIIKNGLPRKYVTYLSNSKYLIGRVDYSQSYINTLKLNKYPIVSLQEMLSYEYDELKIINDAYVKYKKITGNKINDFEKISAILSKHGSYRGKKVSSVEFKQLHKCYDLALIIIENLSGYSLGGEQNRSFFLNAHNIYESFITKLIRKLIPDQLFVEKKRKVVASTEDELHFIYSEPDLLYEGPNNVIIDMKNKNFYKAIQSSDYHQMISYMMNYSASTAILIYPIVKDYPGEQVFLSHNSNPLFISKIIRLGINVRTPNYKDIRNQILRIISSQ